MSKYETIPREIEAEQFLGHNKPFELEGVNLIHLPGAGGYHAKLAYLDTPSGERKTVRPQDYIAIMDGKPTVISKIDFEKQYRKKLTLPKMSGKRKVSGDNAG